MIGRVPAMSIDRAQWDEVVEAFSRFFEGRGEVVVTENEIEFRASITGLSLRRDGTSRSFMPLHELGARWEEVEFDPSGREVRLRGSDMTYTYRVPG
jgi:hypothetical protein